MKIRKLLCDGGCSSILLPIEDIDELRKIFRNHQNHCTFHIRKGNTPGGSTIALVLKKTNPFEKFDISLCSDIMQNLNIQVEMLRFSLCTDDINWILENDSANQNISPEAVEYLRQETKHYGRRTHGLLGQHILDRFTCIKHNGCKLYVDASKYQLPSNFRTLDFQVDALRSQLKVSVPDEFDDWEDDDFAFEDDDYITDEETC